MTRRNPPGRNTIKPMSKPNNKPHNLRNYSISSNQSAILNEFISRMQEIEMQREMQRRYNNMMNQKIRNMRTRSLKAGVPPQLLIDFTRNNAKHLLRWSKPFLFFSKLFLRFFFQLFFKRIISPPLSSFFMLCQIYVYSIFHKEKYQYGSSRRNVRFLQGFYKVSTRFLQGL